MKLLKLLKTIDHKGPGQARILDNPSINELLEATNEVSHHIIVKAHNVASDFMGQQGWERNRADIVPLEYFHFVPIIQKVKCAADFFGMCYYVPYLEELIESLPEDAVILEIGTHLGKSAAYMSEITTKLGKSINIITVDTYYPAPRAYPHPTVDWFNNIQAWKDAGLYDKITSLKGHSSIILKSFSERTIDHIHLDIDNNGDNVTETIQMCIGKLKLKGTISGCNYSGTRKIVNALFPQMQLRINQDIWISNRSNYKPPSD